MNEERATLFVGRFWTADRSQPWADALVANSASGCIEFVGADPRRQGPIPESWRVVEFPPGAVGVPAFHEAHNHWGFAVFDHAADVNSASNASEVVRRVRERREVQAGGWLIGCRWNTGVVPTLGLEAADRISTELPVAVFDQSFHSIQLNSLAAGMIEPEVRREQAAGLPTTLVDGLLLECSQLVLRKLWLPRELLGPSLASRQRVCFAEGIASFDDMDVMGAPLLSLLRQMYEHGELTIPSQGWLDVARFGDESLLRPDSTGDFSIVGMKDYADGALGAWTAALDEPYSDGRGGRGMRLLTAERYRPRLERALRAGFERVAIHAIGDAGVRDAVEMLQFARDAFGSDAAPHRIRVEHLELVAEDCIPRLRDLGAAACMQPNFLSDRRDYAERLGERRNRLCPHRRILKAGIPLGFGSDGMPTGPLHGIRHAVFSDSEESRLSVEEAFVAYTRDAQEIAGNGSSRGMLKAGMEANVALLDRDVFADPASLRSVGILATWLRGDCVFTRG